MGGLAIRVGDDLPESERFLPSENCGFWFLDTEAIPFLLKNDERGGQELPNLSEEEIQSKSKANGLAKTLVCIQVSWFIAQCLTRCK